jgi:hypothetical protein
VLCVYQFRHSSPWKKWESNPQNCLLLYPLSYRVLPRKGFEPLTHRLWRTLRHCRNSIQIVTTSALWCFFETHIRFAANRQISFSALAELFCRCGCISNILIHYYFLSSKTHYLYGWFGCFHVIRVCDFSYRHRLIDLFCKTKFVT